MPEFYQSYNCFISSPGDVAAERQMAEETISRMNRTCLDTLKLNLNVKKWENLPPQTPHLPEEKIQDLINREVEKSNFFILILYKRYGRVEEGHKVSNTEREINTILELYKKKPELKILAYFRELTQNEDPGEQERKVRDFRRRLEEMGIMYRYYSNAEMFKEEFTHDLYNVILRMKISTYKNVALHRFWQLGEVDRPDTPKLGIFYPPISRQYNDPQKDPDFWLKRLEPNIYHEDHKAIEKLRKTLALIGLHHYGVYSSLNVPPDWRFMNRVWLCIPRFKLAINQYKKYKDTVRFSFTKRTEKYTAKIKWKDNKGDIITVTSPLKTYFYEQRKDMDTSEEWHQQLGSIIGKDYAIIARICDSKSYDIATEGLLHDYFLAGIRGLGTWGSAWFLDRKSKFFMETEERGCPLHS